MKAIKINPTGAIENIELAADDELRLHQLQNAVDGWIQTIPLTGFSIVIDQDAEPLCHPLRNRIAEQIAADYLADTTIAIHGCAVLIAADGTSDLPLYVAEYLGLFNRPDALAAA